MIDVTQRINEIRWLISEQEFFQLGKCGGGYEMTEGLLRVTSKANHEEILFEKSIFTKGDLVNEI